MVTEEYGGTTELVPTFNIVDEDKIYSYNNTTNSNFGKKTVL